MNRSKLLRFSIELGKSFSSTRHSGLSWFSLTQVTHFSNFTQFHPTSFPTKPYACCNPFNFQQNLLFSSKPESFIHVVLSNDWSEKIEKELDKLSPKLTHESVLYVLMNSNTNPQKSLDFFKWVCVKKGFCPSFSPYFILLRCLACKEYMVEFWNVFSEMKKKGFYIDDKAYSTINVKLTSEKLYEESTEWTKRYKEMVEIDVEKDVAKEVLELIVSCDWGEEVKGKLSKKLKFPLRENFLLRMIADLWQQPLKALNFFEWIGSCGGYEHDSVTYNAMARVLAHHNSVSELWNFLKQMRTEGFEIDIYTYVKSLKHLPVKDIVELSELMMDGPYPPSVQHTTSLLAKIMGELDPDIDLVYRVFNKFVRTGNTPTKILYDGVHRALCNLGRFDEAKMIVEDLRNSGYEPDNFTYSQEIFGLCKAGKFNKACKVLEQMEVDGCIPDVKTWTMLIEGHCEAKQVDQALSCFEKMQEKNVSPSPETLTVLIKGFISENRVLDAYSFFNDLVKKEGQLKPRQNTYKLMIEKLAEAGKLKEALDILSMMKKQHFRVFPQPITQYISKYGTVDDAVKLLMVLSPNVTSAINVYGKVIKAFLEQGRYSEAKDLVHASPARVGQDEAILKMFRSKQGPPLEEVSKG